jgi:hypothetical protein
MALINLEQPLSDPEFRGWYLAGRFKTLGVAGNVGTDGYVTHTDSTLGELAIPTFETLVREILESESSRALWPNPSTILFVPHFSSRNFANYTHQKNVFLRVYMVPGQSGSTYDFVRGPVMDVFTSFEKRCGVGSSSPKVVFINPSPEPISGFFNREEAYFGKVCLLE